MVMQQRERERGAPGPTPGLRPGRSGPFRPLRLRVEHGPDAGRSFVVGKPGATLGSQDDNSIVLTDPAVSRRHARLEAHGEVLTITDLGSRHGTWVNGQRLAGPCLLRPGDTVGLGNSTLRAEPAFGTGALAAPRAQEADHTAGGAGTAGTAALLDVNAPDAGVYRTPAHERGASAEPDYELRGGRLYRTPWHPRGPSHHPDYEQRGGALYRTAHHELGASATPDYLVQGGSLCRTGWHPRWASITPDYRLGAPGRPVTTWGGGGSGGAPTGW